MESQLKQRLIGAAVLVALAVIFLPMLVQGPAPDSGVSDVPLTVPPAPQGDARTRDLPLVLPDEAPAGGATGMPTAAGNDRILPMVDTTTAPGASESVPLGEDGETSTAAMLPARVAGGDYAVHFGAYSSSVSADTVISRLRTAQLPAYREAATLDGKPAYRVRIGPYATRADAEIARLEAVRAGKQSGARVVALDAEQAATASTAQPGKTEPGSTKLVSAEPVVKTQSLPPEPAKPATKTAAVAVAPPVAAQPSPPAASGVGFAVQLGAFGNAAQATRKRDELRVAGFSAFTETVNTDKGVLTRVLAGPVVSRDDADKLKAQVKAKLGIDGMVRAHP